MASTTTIASKDSRSLELSDGSSNKFWKIALDGASHNVTFGRIGTSGQTQTKDFADDAAARKAFDKLVDEKLKKGYVDAGAIAAAAAGPTPPTPVAKIAKPRAKKEQAAEPAPAPPDSTEISGAASTPNRANLQPRPAGNATASRHIALDPKDWFRAGFQPHRRLQRGSPQPFDKQECLERLAKLKIARYGYQVSWHELQLPAALSPEEAHFWLLAMVLDRPRECSMRDYAEKIGKQKAVGKPSATQLKTLVSYILRCEDQGMIPLANLWSAEEIMVLMLDSDDPEKPWNQAQIRPALADGFARHVLPYVSDTELESLRRRILQSNWDPTVQSISQRPLPPEYYLAAALGMHDEVREVVSQWADDRYAPGKFAEFYEWPECLVFGLGSPDEVVEQWRRLRLHLRSPEDARGLLASIEYLALDCLADAVIAQTNKDKCEEMLRVLALVDAPEAAEAMLRCKLGAKSPSLARDWLDSHLDHAVAGLIATAGGQGKLADAAIERLQALQRLGHTDLISHAVKAGSPSQATGRVQTEVLDREEKLLEPLDAATTPKWLKSELANAATIKHKTLPSWACAAMLPPLPIGDRRLNDEQLTTILQSLMATPVTGRNSLLAAIRQHVDKHARDAFVWQLFGFWHDDGCPNAQKWAMGAIGQLGDEGCVLKLTPLIRDWPGESQHARAVYGLECLRAVGTNVALMHLSGIAQKLKFKGLKAKAEQFVEEIAKEKGLTRSELEDRVVPDCGLDAKGCREFSYGPRSFSFVLGSDLKAMVRDADGKLRPDLPKPSGKDDPSLANASLAEWKLLKKQIKEVAAIQAGRLERAMVAGRRWSPQDFQSLLVEHPLMTHLVQKLIWSAHNARGKIVGTFRVTEERDLADVKDERFDLADAEQIGIVHPLELSADERAAWGEVLSDYEIVTPFTQLGREVHALETGEAKDDALNRFSGLKLVAPTLVFTLEKLGWTRGLAMDAGCFDEHSKQFPAAGVTAVVCYEGTVGMGYIDPNELLTLGPVVFCEGMRAPSGYAKKFEKTLKLGKVHPIVVSEVLADMQVLKGKAK